MYFIEKKENEWWELDKETMCAFNFFGGYHTIKANELQICEVVECENWRDLYIKKRYCPLEVTIKWRDVWISPEGKYYNGEAHENRAEEILEIIYGEPDNDWAGDRLEQLGWIRATASLMWEVRADSEYWDEKKLTQKQFDALWDWCENHNKTFPHKIEVI